jgi:multidrug resistance efflux pump
MAEEVKSKAAIQEAEATVKVAEAEVIESESINAAAPGSIPPTQLRRQRLTEERARMQVDVAKRDAETAQLTVRLRQAQIDVAQINLDRHRINAPWDAVVVQLYKHVGEWVNAGEPILRIIHLDKLRVEGFLDINDMLPEEVAGRAVMVEVRLKDRTEVFKSVISYVSPEIEASGEYRVWAEVENRSIEGNPILRPGMDAEMLISLDDNSVARVR